MASKDTDTMLKRLADCFRRLADAMSIATAPRRAMGRTISMSRFGFRFSRSKLSVAAALLKRMVNNGEID